MQQSLFPMGEKPAKDTSQSRISRKDLNEAQYQAVTSLTGSHLVIAGAGSGKTRTLVYRLAYLIEQGVPPEQILLLTFTRKAAQEMLNRASLLLDDSCQQVMGGTFHAMANMLLRRYCRYLGYPPNFTILDQSDAEGIVNLIKSSLNFGGETKRFPSKRVIINILSKAVNKNISVDELVDDEYGHLHDFVDDLVTIRNHYKKFKLEHGLMDYDDLLINWRKILRDFPEVQEELAARFSHIMVDEYQDTNPIQAEIVRLMAHGHDNVMVVGDDSQSIYSFRGADFRNIMDFPKLFSDTTIIRLEENYRSTQKILDVTNAIIERAQEKYTKNLFTRIEGGDKPTIHSARDESVQARYVAQKIVELHDNGTDLSEIAVLFRSGFHSYKLELELANRHLEFEKRGGLKLTESAHIKDVLSYLRLMTNSQDHLSWNRILLLLEKVGPKTAQNILSRVKTADDPWQALGEYPAAKGWAKGFNDMLEMLLDLQKPGRSIAEMFDVVMEYYQPIFERIYHDDYPRRSKDLDQLQVIMAGYDSLQTFLDDTSLDPPQVDADPLAEDSGKLILTTIHSAKGLEWDNVFIINLANGKFPGSKAILPEHLEEERRLLYVAATRARKNLFLVYPREVQSFDPYAKVGGISPFLAELPHSITQSSMPASSMIPDGPDFSVGSSLTGYAAAKRTSTVSNEGADTEEFAPGKRVRHGFFGEGKIERVVGNRKLEIFFPRHGRKTLHLDYAKLEVLD